MVHRRTTLVPAGDNHLPVHTLTFTIPPLSTLSACAIPHHEARAYLGDVVKMVIPGYKPESYSISEMCNDAFDVTLEVYPNGRASGHLDRLHIGDTVNTFGMVTRCSRSFGNTSASWHTA